MRAAAFAATLIMFIQPSRALAQRAMGIDVHRGFGWIDWTRVKNAGYVWAWAKASEGVGYQDSQFVNNINNARAAGVLIGAYHYARYDLGNSGANEANWFWQVVSPYLRNDGSEIMPMLDVEDDLTNNPMTADQVSAWVVDFCNTFNAKAAQAGYTLKMVIYTYPWYSSTYLNSSVTQNYFLDMATLNGENPQTGAPDKRNWPTWSSWQYSWTIHVDGVPGDGNGSCLMDVYNGSLAQMKQSFVIGCPDIVITNQPVSLVCTQGNNASLSVVAGPVPLTYQWRKNGGNISGATTATLSFNSATSSNSGGYDVVISNCKSVTSDVATLTVLVGPGITNQPDSVEVLVGHSTNLSIAASGSLPLTYQWRWNNISILTGTAATNTGNLYNAGSYWCIVSNQVNMVTSDVVTLSYLYPPTITNQPQSAAVLQSRCTNFVVGAGGTTPLYYQWHYNTSPAVISTAADSGCEYSPGSYSVVVSNRSGLTVTSSMATLSILYPPTITAQPQNRTNLAGWGTLFSVGAGGTAPLYYQWWCNGAANAPGTDNTLMAYAAGSYSVVVSNQTGLATQSATVLLVLTNALPGQFNAITRLENGSVLLNMSGTPGTNYTLLWTADWLSWPSLGALPSGNGQFQYTDTSTNRADQRFYRLRLGQ